MTGGPDKSELYATYVETISAAEQRRQNASAIYFALASAAIAFWGSEPSVEPLIVVAPVTLGSLLWFFKLSYFRALAKAKFAVLAEIENGWDFRPFEREWVIFKNSRHSTRRIALTFLEMAIPLCLFLGGLAYLAYRGGLFLFACW